jgi:CheY-like chemotaxis protein
MVGTVDLILDVMLPGLNGFEVLRRARQRTDVPLVMLTARVDHDDHLRGFDAGADDYLPKPFEPSELLAGCAPCCAVWRAPVVSGEALTLGRFVSFRYSRGSCATSGST